MDMTFMDALQHFRNLCGFPFVIESGFRCPSQNRNVGGESDSMHLMGRAADIAFHNGTEYFKLVKFSPIFFSGLGFNNGSYHVDNRTGEQVAWNYYHLYEKIKSP